MIPAEARLATMPLPFPNSLGVPDCRIQNNALPEEFGELCHDVIELETYDIAIDVSLVATDCHRVTDSKLQTSRTPDYS